MSSALPGCKWTVLSDVASEKTGSRTPEGLGAVQRLSSYTCRELQAMAGVKGGYNSEMWDPLPVSCSSKSSESEVCTCFLNSGEFCYYCFKSVAPSIYSLSSSEILSISMSILSSRMVSFLLQILFPKPFPIPLKPVMHPNLPAYKFIFCLYRIHH